MTNHILLQIFLLLSTIIADNRGWVHPETGWEVFSGSHMSIITFNYVYINNELAESDRGESGFGSTNAIPVGSTISPRNNPIK